MWRLKPKACATLVLIILASLACMAPADAQSEAGRDRPEHRPTEAVRQAAHREAPTPQSHAYPPHAQGAPATARAPATYSRQTQIVTNHRELAGHNTNGSSTMAMSVAGGARLVGSGPMHAVTRSFAGGQVQATRYGSALSGTVERTIRPGLISRTFVGGGHVLYAHVYQRHYWHQFGRAFVYETFVPPVRFPGVYFAWALAAWPRPMSYAWGWQAQAWYPTYGSQFTPYAAYTSPDLWMTDYIIAQNMQTAYQAQPVAPAAQSAQQDVPVAPAPDTSVTAPPAQPSDATLPPQPSDSSPASQSNAATDAPVTPPPAITPEVKAQLNAQIKVQLQEQQAAAAIPVSLTSQSTPPALRPNHVFFEVVQPIDVQSDSANGHCSLNANDYIKRTGAMSNDDWMIPVVVELSRPSDCPEGLATRIGLNDLNAMENEQEAQVVAAMQAASKSMGPNGPPSGPGAQPTLIADGKAAPEPMALDAIRQTQ
jgi:hypothetical protein